MASYEVYHTFETKLSHGRNKRVIGVKLLFQHCEMGDTKVAYMMLISICPKFICKNTPFPRYLETSEVQS